MIARGVIHITIQKEAHPLCPPGVVVCEKEDGKGTKEVVPLLVKGCYLFSMPLTEDNIEIAKRFFCRRYCKVEVIENPLVIPFDTEVYEKWLKEDNAFLAKKSKELKAATDALKKHVASLPALLDTLDTQATLQVVREHEAQASRRPRPEPTKAFLDAQAKYQEAKALEKELEHKIESIKAEIA